MRVLLATDFSSGAALASDWLTRASWPPGTQVEALHVSPAPRAGVLGLLWKARAAAANEQVSAAAGVLATRLGGRISVMSSTRVGDPGTAIVERAAETRADLVVLGSRGRGHFAGHLLGSVSAAVATNASCSVVVVRRETLRSLLLADDGSGSAETAAQTLLAWSFLAPVPTAISAIVDTGTQPAPSSSPWVPSAERRAADAVEQRVAEFRALGRMAIGRVAQGDASVEILRAARAAGTDMIVVGVGSYRRGEARPLGRVARSVLWGFRGSVLIARGDHVVSEYAVDATTRSGSASSVSRALN